MNSSTEKNDMHPSCEFRENLSILREISYFSVLPLETLKVFAYLCTRETFKAGDYLFHQDEDDGQAFYIICGKARLVQVQDGNEQEIRDFGPEAFLGGMSLMGNMRRLFTLKALTDVTCLILTREKFSRALEQFSDLVPKILNALVERVRLWEEHSYAYRVEHEDACKRCVGVSLI